jgi:Zinc-finger double-stranded RNA-binding
MTDANKPSISPKFYCDSCDIGCSKKSEWERHLTTRKHKNNSGYLQKAPAHVCSCGKIYKHRQSLFTHKQKCEIIPSMIEPKEERSIEQQQPSITNDMILTLIEQNKELQKQLIEMSKQNNIVNNNTTNNTMNNQFNLNVFLNEDCKDALNIADFINSLKLTVTDLEQTGKLGFTQGITRIFVQALKQLDVNMRPLHCTDIKRETVYIKDQDTWEKEDAEKTKLRNVIKQLARKNLKVLPEWQQENPEYRYLDTPENKKFMEISINSLGSEFEDEQEKMDDKIIRNVLKEVVLDKKVTPALK